MTTAPSDDGTCNHNPIVQWDCDCGAHCRYDGKFAYAVKCQHCGKVRILHKSGTREAFVGTAR